MNFKKNISEIKRRLTDRKEAIEALTRFLVSKGMSAPICEEILEEISFPTNEFEDLKKRISSRIKVTGDFLFQKPQRVVFIGPTGVGKTATIMKLAAYYQLKNKTVCLMSLDNRKNRTLKLWSEERGVKYIRPNFDKEQDYDILLIDTEGCNFYQPNRIDELGESIATIAQDVEIILTLSSAAKEVDLYGAVHQFSSLGPSSLLFTKFDETLASGVVINISMKTDMPIRYIAYGFPLPGEVQIADQEIIAHKILTDFNEESFQILRQLTM